MLLYFWRFFVSRKMEQSPVDNGCLFFFVPCFPYEKLMSFESETYIFNVRNVWLSPGKHKMCKVIE